MSKRLFDLVLSGAGLVLLSPVVLAIAIAIKLDSPGPVFFRQERIGREFRPFRIFKFRTMRDSGMTGPPLTIGDDPRITRVGRWLRARKLDEVPQLMNVLAGHMSLVGPRPELRWYVERFRPEFDTILQVRPGMTDAASLRFKDEAAELARFDVPEEAYEAIVLPKKIEMAREYVRTASTWRDLRLILKSMALVFSRREL